MPKLTQAQQLQLLSALLGEDVEAVDANDDFNIDDLLAKVDDKRSDFVMSKKGESIRNEANIAADGRWMNLFRRELKKLTGHEPNPDLDWREDMKGAFEKVKSLNDVDKNQFQQSMRELEEKLNNEKTAAVQEWEQKYNGLNKQIADGKAIEYLQSFLSDKKISGDKRVWANDLYKHLQENVHVQYDENGKALQFFDKANNSIPAKNALGTQTFKLDEFADNFFTQRGAITQDMRNVNPATAMQQATAKPAAMPTNAPTTGFAGLQSQLASLG